MACRAQKDCTKVVHGMVMQMKIYNNCEDLLGILGTFGLHLAISVALRKGAESLTEFLCIKILAWTVKL